MDGLEGRYHVLGCHWRNRSTVNGGFGVDFFFKNDLIFGFGIAGYIGERKYGGEKQEDVWKSPQEER